MSRRALLLVNRKAHSGRRDLTVLREQLSAGGLELVEDDSGKSHDLSESIRRRKDDVELVIVGGGDGTLHHALEGLLDTGLPLGILPLGTANDLARTLELPTDPAAACEVITAGRTRRIDVGWVNGKHFFNVASLGLAVAVTKRLTRETKSRWGVLAYLVAAIQALMSARPFNAELRSEGETVLTRTIQITVGNGRYYGGGMTVNEHAEIDDGLLHLYSLEVERWWHILPLFPALRRGTLDPVRAVRTLRGKGFTVHPLRRPRTVIADGEEVGQTPAEFRLIRNAVTVFAPPSG